MNAQFRVLGAMAIDVDGDRLELGHARQRALLAILLVEAARPVGADELVDRLWVDSPPRRARETLYSYLSRLRTILDAAGTTISRSGGGYALDVDPAAVDMHRFSELVAHARAASDSRAAPLWDEAFALWRGAPFSDVDLPWLDIVARRLEAERAAAAADRVDVLLRLGQHSRMIPELTELLAEHPMDERLAGQLMLALYRNGRAAAALEQYSRLRSRLVEALGNDPGPDLQQLHRRILAADPDLATPRPHPETTGTADAAPRHLPHDVPEFVGRAEQLAELDALLDVDRPTATGLISTLSGAGGVGKTALAVHWAHSPRAREAFPDGSLYVDLQGFSGEEPVSADEALGQLLRQLGVPGSRVPHDREAARALCRSRLEGRACLVVLDNTVDAEQVRPLLLAESPSLTLITGRDRLDGLAARDGARRIFVDRLSAAEAESLARRLLGSNVADSQPTAITRLIDACARLPLAIRVAAAGYESAHPAASLPDYVDELTDDRLGMLDAGGDEATAVASVLAHSTARLSQEAARGFCLLGVHPGPRLDSEAAAALLEMPQPRARHMLRELSSASLLEQSDSNRFGMHDLLREHAREEAARLDVDVDAASTRLLEHYVDRLSDSAEPAWVRGELPSLIACLQLRSSPALGDYAHRLGQSLHALGFLSQALEAHKTARDSFTPGSVRQLRATLHMGKVENVLGEPGAERRLTEAMNGFRGLGQRRDMGLAMLAQAELKWRLGDFKAAADCNAGAAELFRQAGDVEGEAEALTSMSMDCYTAGDHTTAAEHARKAAAMARDVGSRRVEAEALYGLGAAYRAARDFAEATANYEAALKIFRETGKRQAEARGLSALGRTAVEAEEHERALEYFQQSAKQCRRVGATHDEAVAMHGMGRALRALGRADSARESFSRSKELFGFTEDMLGEVHAQLGIADILLDSGNFAEAAADYRFALDSLEKQSVPRPLAWAHFGLGRASAALGRDDQAREHLNSALELYEQLQRPEAAEARAALEALDSGSSAAPDGTAEPV